MYFVSGSSPQTGSKKSKSSLVRGDGDAGSKDND